MFNLCSRKLNTLVENVKQLEQKTAKELLGFTKNKSTVNSFSVFLTPFSVPLELFLLVHMSDCEIMYRSAISL